ncbi:MAG: ribokinase [bacterium]|nr:ribokinase [bacterium]
MAKLNTIAVPDSVACNYRKEASDFVPGPRFLLRIGAEHLRCSIRGMSIVVVGSIGIDFVAVAPRLPKVGETVLATQPLYIGPGGKGFNQAVGVARLGGDVRFATKTGKGNLGSQARSFLEGEGLLGPLTRQSETDNQVALIFVDDSGHNMISVTPGASADVLPSDVADLGLAEGDILLAQLEIPVATVTAAARHAKAAGATVVLNPAPATPLPDELLSLVDIATPNETELSILTGMPTDTTNQVVAAGERLVAMGVGEVVATVGSKGAVHIEGSGSTKYESLLVDAIDTTGAGDAFNAGLVVGMSRGLSLAAAIELGGQSGAYCVTRLGVLDGLATAEELAAFAASQ